MPSGFFNLLSVMRCRLRIFTAKLIYLLCSVLIAMVVPLSHADGSAEWQRSFVNQWESKKIGYNPYFTNFERSLEQNAVLHLMNLGKMAFIRGDFYFSGACFDLVMEKIEDIYGYSSNARGSRQRFFKAAEKATDLWYQESVKHFRGEPYERMMVYFYRGLITYGEKLPDLARAIWENGAQQDAFAEEEQYQCDFAPIEILSAWAAKEINAMSLIDQKKSQLSRINSPLLTPSENHKTLVVIESGRGPVKKRKGEYGSLLAFDCPHQTISTVALLHNDSKIDLKKTGDLCYQASTRGGRWIDGVLAQKVVFKGQWENIASSYQSQRSVMHGGAMFRQGGLARRQAQETRPEADIRQWSNLSKMFWMQYLPFSINKDNIQILVNDTQVVNKKILQFGNIVWIQL